MIIISYHHGNVILNKLINKPCTVLHIGAFLRRIDTCYDRPQKSTDKVTNEKFLEATIRHLKTHFPNNNLEYKRNSSGELIKVGHRTSNKYYRVSLKGQYLQFEFEHKHVMKSFTNFSH